MNTLLEPEVETTEPSLRQLSMAELVASQLRKMAADLNQKADALEIAYGVQLEPQREVLFTHSIRKTPRTKKGKK